MPTIRKLSPELEKIAGDNEDKDRIKEDLKHIRLWLSKQPHLNVRDNDQWLLSFLRGCKYSLERTKEKLDSYHTIRTLIPDIFRNRDPLQPELQYLLAHGLFLPLENKSDPAGPAILFYRKGSFDPFSANIYDIFKYLFIVLDILINENDNLGITGLIVLNDMKDVTYTQMALFTPGLAKKVSMAVQEGYPLKFKGVNFFNTPSGFDTFFTLLKSVVNEKLRKRYNANKNIESVFKTVPKENFPMEYGGNAGTLHELTDKWKTKIESYRNWLIEDDEYCSDERLRPGKPRTTESLLGIDGSFRRLSID